MALMTTRATIWTVFTGVLVLLLAVFFVWRSSVEPAQSEPASGRPVARPGPAVVDDGSSWTMFGGGQGLLGRASGTLGSSLSVLWKFRTGAEVKSSAAIAGGRVFIGSSDANLYAIDLHTGEKQWSYATEDAVEGAPCVIDGTVFAGSGDGWLYALDAGSGQLRWKYETEGEILGAANWTSAPDGEGTWILVGSYDNRVHCVDAETGHQGKVAVEPLRICVLPPLRIGLECAVANAANPKLLLAHKQKLSPNGRPCGRLVGQRNDSQPLAAKCRGFVRLNGSSDGNSGVVHLSNRRLGSISLKSLPLRTVRIP